MEKGNAVNDAAELAAQDAAELARQEATEKALTAQKENAKMPKKGKTEAYRHGLSQASRPIGGGKVMARRRGIPAFLERKDGAFVPNPAIEVVPSEKRRTFHWLLPVSVSAPEGTTARKALLDGESQQEIEIMITTELFRRGIKRFCLYAGSRLLDLKDVASDLATHDEPTLWPTIE